MPTVIMSGLYWDTGKQNGNYYLEIRVHGIVTGVQAGGHMGTTMRKSIRIRNEIYSPP